VLPSEALVAGVPAKVLRALTPEQRDRVAANWQTYVALKERYRSNE
jgi:carbonic anhydrase/acetyltransferase-like protein (isoleucine patch superfamily)